MFLKIKRILQNLTTPKKDIEWLTELRDTHKIIHNEAIPSLELVIAHLEKSNVKVSDVKELRVLADGIKFNHNSGLHLMRLQLLFVEELKNNLDDLSNLAEGNLPPYTSEDGVSAREGAILALIQDFTAISRFMVEYTVASIYGIGNTDNSYDKRSFFNNLDNYIELYNGLNGKIKNKLKDIPKLSDIRVTVDNANHVDKIATKNDNKFRLPVNGFVGNPFYHIGKFITDNQIEGNENLKNNKKLLELKLYELRLAKNGENDAELTKQIEYYEEEIESYKHRIEMFEGR